MWCLFNIVRQKTSIKHTQPKTAASTTLLACCCKHWPHVRRLSVLVFNVKRCPWHLNIEKRCVWHTAEPAAAGKICLFCYIFISGTVSRTAASGMLYSICTTPSTGGLRESEGGVRALAGAFLAAVAATSRYGGAAEGDRTMLDALAPAARSLQDASATGAGGFKVLFRRLFMLPHSYRTLAHSRAHEMDLPILSLRLLRGKGAVVSGKWRHEAGLHCMAGQKRGLRLLPSPARHMYFKLPLIAASLFIKGPEACRLPWQRGPVCLTGCSVEEALQRAAAAAMEGAQRTAELSAGAGRASYIPGAQYVGLPDPGALGVATWLRAAAGAAMKP